jgi:hypothetical protein
MRCFPALHLIEINMLGLGMSNVTMKEYEAGFRHSASSGDKKSGGLFFCGGIFEDYRISPRRRAVSAQLVTYDKKGRKDSFLPAFHFFHGLLSVTAVS